VRDTYAAYGDACVPCATLPIPPGAPYVVYRALWNATPGVRWWPPAFDPPHMRPRPSLSTAAAAEEEEEPRAGVCWPCAATTQAPYYYSDDPCGLITPKHNEEEELQIIRLPIPKKRRLLHLLLAPSTRTAYTLDRRRLEWTPLTPEPRPLRNRAAPPPRCDRGWTIEEPRHLRPRCVPCPPWATTTATDDDASSSVCVPIAPSKKKRRTPCPMALALPQPFAEHLCGCIPGTELDANRSACVRCPRGTVSRSLGNAPCVPLGASSTTTTTTMP
jgi:hypothetical protein